jgi:hypothetical protein
LILDFETINEDFNTTLKILCEEFSVKDQIKTSKKQKRIKKKSRQQINKVCHFLESNIYQILFL